MIRLSRRCSAWQVTKNVIADDRHSMTCGKRVEPRSRSTSTVTTGFVVSDRGKYEEQLTTLFPTPLEIVNVWLARAGLFRDFVRYVVISPWSGRELAEVQ